MNMSKLLKVIGAGLLLVPALQVAAAEDFKTISGSFDGWRQTGDANWRLENGEFVADMGRGFLMTQESYADMHIKLEFFAGDGKANSGVYFRLEDPDAITRSLV